MYNNAYYGGGMGAMNNMTATPYVNPTAPMQQRLQQYEQQAYPNSPTAQNMIKCRAVTSIDEAKAAMIDLDGSMTIFTDLGHNRIYTKQINLDGTATLNSYALEQLVPESNPGTVSEERIRGLEEAVVFLKGELENVKSNTDNADNKSTKKQSKSNGTT